MKRNRLLWWTFALLLSGCDDVNVDNTCHTSDDCTNVFDCQNGECRFDPVKDCNNRCDGTCNSDGVCVKDQECSSTAIQCDKDENKVVLVCTDNHPNSRMQVIEDCSDEQRCLESGGKVFCGECAEDDDCAMNDVAQLCNSEHRCVQCIEDVTCGETAVCNSMGECVSKQIILQGEDCELTVECDETMDELIVKCNQETIDSVFCPNGCMKIQREGQETIGVCKSEDISEPEPECTSYELECNADSSYIDLKCDDGTYKEKVIQCGAGEICERGRCVANQKPVYECDDIERVKEEIHQTLTDLNIKGIEEKCGQYVLHANDSTAFDRAKEEKSSCLIICGSVGVNDSDNKEGYELGSIKYLIGINNASIRSNSENNELTHPLFKEIKNATIANLELDYTLSVREGLKENIGMLAGTSDNSLFSNILLNGQIVSRHDQSVSLLGGMIGKSANDTFASIKLNNFVIHLKEPSVHDKCKTSNINNEKIGGLVGEADNLKVENIRIDGLTIDSGYAFYVGGLAGHTTNAKIIGNNDPAVPDISNVFILKTQQYGGGLIGRASGKENEISKLSVSINTVESLLQYTGGLIAFADGNSKHDWHDLTVHIESAFAGRHVGGILGVAEKSNVTIENVEMTSELVHSRQSVCDVSEDKGFFAGGIVGSIRSSASLTIKSLNHSFNQIRANNYAGGILAGIGGSTGSTASIDFEDIINRSTDSKGVYAVANLAGGLIAAAGYSKLYAQTLILKNIINEVSSVYSQDNASGLVAYIQFAADQSASCEISNIISNTHVLTKNSGTGLIGSLILPDNTNVALKMNNILVSGSINLDKTIGSNVPVDATIGGAFYKIDYWKNNTSNPLISNMLINVDVQHDGNSIAYSKVAHTINHDDAVKCPQVDYNLADSNNEKKSIKNTINTIFGNVFYTFVGLNCNGNCKNQGDYSGAYDYSKITYNDKNINNLLCFGGNGACDNYKDINHPIRDCWFNDYVYLKNAKVCKSWSDFYTPILPYHPYSCTEKDPSKCQPPCSETLKVNCIDTTKSPNNVQDVLSSLNTDNTTTWAQCDKLKFEINNGIQFDPKAYPYMLCPVLSGSKYTKMKTK